jgi:hypothetical protein
MSRVSTDFVTQQQAGISNSSSISVTKKSVSASPAIISASEYKLGEQISNENQIFQPLLAVSVLNRPISFQPFVPSIFESQPLDPSNFESLTATSKADSNTKSSGANVVGTPGPEMVPECKQLFVFGVGSGIWLRGHQKDHRTLKQIVEVRSVLHLQTLIVPLYTSFFTETPVQSGKICGQ